MEDDGQVLLCVEISNLLAATEVSLTVSLEGEDSDKAGMKQFLLTKTESKMHFRLKQHWYEG